MPLFINRKSWIARAMLVVGLVAVGGGSMTYYTVIAPRAAGQSPVVAKPTVEPAPKLVRLSGDRIAVPEELAKNMRLKLAAVVAATKPIPMPPFQGTLAYDTNSLARIHSRFPGEVVSMGTALEPSEHSLSSEQPSPKVRPLRQGDPVRKGDLLAVVWSKDLGEKKSELVDAISKQAADERILDTIAELVKQGASPERSLRDAERNVQADRVAVDKAERTLRAWRLSEEEISSIRTEASRLIGADSKRTDSSNWARVEVRATTDGVLLEKNVNIGDIVDPSAVMFQVCDLSHLVVWAHAFEDDLPMLQALPRPLRWCVKIPGQSGVSFTGTLDQIGSVVDPNQHTVMITGRVDNPKGELRVGQFVTVSLSMPAPVGELELPVDAVAEDGRESVVFVETPDKPNEFQRRNVKVSRRFRETILVRAEGGGLNIGDKIVAAGSLLLRDAYSQLPKPAE